MEHAHPDDMERFRANRQERSVLSIRRRTSITSTGFGSETARSAGWRPTRLHILKVRGLSDAP
jgi:hypothetical protein